jgi:acetoacetyl-CoA synthetase
MVELKEVHEDLVGPVKEFLARQEDFGLKSRWEPVFEYRWKLPEFPYGYAIVDGETIAGFLGTLYSRRVVDGESVIFCNMSSWIMGAEYRAMKIGSKLLSPILQAEKLLITNLTPSAAHRKSYEKIGFQVLEEEQISIPVVPRLGANGNGRRIGNRLVTFDKQEIRNRLRGDDLKIFEDHENLPCVHLLVEDAKSGRYCYGVATTSVVHKLKFIGARLLNLCHLSDPDLFAQNMKLVKKYLWVSGRFVFVRYDSRLLRKRLSRVEFKNRGLRLYRSNGIAAPRVDNIYSELITFNKF